MKLKEMLESAACGPNEFPANRGFRFPPTIDVPTTLQSYMVNKWLESELKREEIGGNIRLIVPLPPRPPVVVRPRSGSAPPAIGQLDFQPIDVTDGQGGNSVAIFARRDSDIVGNFHTHPSTPGGTNTEQCGYQPPSIEDVMAMAEQAGLPRNIFVSFVVASRTDLYALVYVRGIARFNAQNQEKVYGVKQELGERGKRIKFPTDKDEEAFFMQLSTSIGLKAGLDQQLELKTKYGEEFSKLVRYYLGVTCNIFSITLYRGDGPILTRQDY